jgi:hypothetical protein
MSYKVEIAPTARDEIVSWGLSKDWLTRLIGRLRNDLETNPDAHLGEVVVPLNLLVYRVTLSDPGPPAVQQVFVFYVERSDDGQQLSIVSCRRVVAGEEDELPDG